MFDLLLVFKKHRLEFPLNRKEIKAAISSIEDIVAEHRIPIQAASMLYSKIKALGYSQANLTRFLKVSVQKAPDLFTLECIDIIVRTTYEFRIGCTAQEKILCSNVILNCINNISTFGMDFNAQLYCWISGLRLNVQLPNFSFGNEFNQLQHILYVCFHYCRPI